MRTKYHSSEIRKKSNSIPYHFLKISRSGINRKNFLYNFIILSLTLSHFLSLSFTHFFYHYVLHILSVSLTCCLTRSLYHTRSLTLSHSIHLSILLSHSLSLSLYSTHFSLSIYSSPKLYLTFSPLPNPSPLLALFSKAKSFFLN